MLRGYVDAFIQNWIVKYFKTIIDDSKRLRSQKRNLLALTRAVENRDLRAERRHKVTTDRAYVRA